VTPIQLCNAKNRNTSILGRENCFSAGVSLALALFSLIGCDLAYPEVAVVNKTGEHILLRNLSFNGCAWNTTLAYGVATSPGRCLPGKDRVHFEKFDAAAYCREQAGDGTITGICPCKDGGVEVDADGGSDAGVDPGLVNQTPLWFNYQTVSVHRVEYGDFQLIEIKLNDMEQDFSVSGPYGH
jgi:hypothetical protein